MSQTPEKGSSSELGDGGPRAIGVNRIGTDKLTWASGKLAK